MIMDLKEIQHRLRDRKVAVISREIGINPTTLLMIKNGKSKNPSFRTLEKLTKYFNQNN